MGTLGDNMEVLLWILNTYGIYSSRSNIPILDSFLGCCNLRIDTNICKYNQGTQGKASGFNPGSCCVGLIWIPTGVLLYDAIGFYMRTYVSLVFAMTLAGLIPLSAPIEKKG